MGTTRVPFFKIKTMKREILYKAQREDGEGGVEGDLVTNKPTQSFRIITEFALCQNAKHTSDGLHHVSGNVYLVDPATVCQYTGLNDRNGRKIFEGDQLFVSAGYSSVVGFESGCFVSIYSHPEDGETIPLYDAVCEDTVVTGNIHDK